MSGFRITELWAYTQVDPSDDDEGVIAWLNGGVWVPLVAADLARLDGYRPLAKDTAVATGIPVHLRHFYAYAEDEEVIEP